MKIQFSIRKSTLLYQAVRWSYHKVMSIVELILNYTIGFFRIIFDRLKSKADVLYNSAQNDRSGAQIMNNLMAYSYCFHNNLRYGGSIGKSFLKDRKGLEILLGLPRSKKYGLSNLSRRTYRENEEDFSNTHAIWSAAFRNHLQKLTSVRPIERLSPKCVVHIRRGDINPIDWPERYVKNSEILQVIAKIKNCSPDVQFEFHSEPESFESLEIFQTFGKLVLNAPLESVYTAFIQADILLISKSAFSFVPGVFNPNTVLYFPFHHGACENWLDVTSESFESSLSNALR